MKFTKYCIFLTALLVTTGSINSLTLKWANRTKAVGSDGIERPFNHPFVQTCTMFIGEVMCLLAFAGLYLYYLRKHDGSVDTKTLVKGNRKVNPLFLYLPALCDMCATSLMNYGLTLTYVSSYQMLRGAVIIFTALLSRLFLHKKLGRMEWAGILIVIIGLVLVGLSDFLVEKVSSAVENDTLSIIAGDLIIVIATAFQAAQVVIEEKFVSDLNIPPLQTVGLEGVFGFATLSVLLIAFYFIPVKPPMGENAHHVLEDTPDAFVKMKNSPILILAVICNTLSIAFFNFAGVAITKELSATTRMILDSIRIFTVWIVSLALRWQKFHYLQPLGCIIILVGVAIYNKIQIGFRRPRITQDRSIVTSPQPTQTESGVTSPQPTQNKSVVTSPQPTQDKSVVKGPHTTQNRSVVNNSNTKP